MQMYWSRECVYLVYNNIIIIYAALTINFW